jgi:hypothetical protein
MPHPADVTARMQELVAQWQTAADRRFIFLNCYLVMTRNMQNALAAQEFEDTQWVGALLDRFAGYYFEALELHEREQAPAIWQLTFAAAAEPRTHVLQNLLMGINAHINYDLVLALGDVLAPEWAGLDESRQLARYQDHCHVNTIIGRSIDIVQDEVVEPLEPVLDLVDRFFGSLDERAASRLIARWREEVWRSTQRLLLATSPADREQVRQDVEAAALRRARVILLRRAPGRRRLVPGLRS